MLFIVVLLDSLGNMCVYFRGAGGGGCVVSGDSSFIGGVDFGVE